MRTLALSLPLLLAASCASTRSADPGLDLANRPIELNPDAVNVGIVIFPGLFITELVAPFDIYQHAGDKLNVFSVAATDQPIHTYYGIALAADYTFENCPEIDVLVVPSGIHSVDTDLDDAALQKFVREHAARATWVTSHCWGAFTLAKAGILDGRSCMTFPTSIDQLQEMFPATKTRKDRRFVVDGNVVTSGGGLAAFEASLWIVQRLLGRDEAQKIADGLVFAAQNRGYVDDPEIEDR